VRFQFLCFFFFVCVLRADSLVWVAVRGAYIRFVMSFFVASDVNVKKAVLEIKGFVFNLIRGFKDDPPEVSLCL